MKQHLRSWGLFATASIWLVGATGCPTPPDAGKDGGPGADSGSGADAGSDAGAVPDAGNATDAGGGADAGQPWDGGGPGTANLWIDTVGGSCTRSATLVAYDPTTACGSIQAAYTACVPGDEIGMKAGTYGSQTVTGSKAAPGCAVTAEAGSVIGPLSTSGGVIALRNLTVDAGTGHASGGWFNSGSGVTLEGVRIHGPYASVFIGGGSGVIWRGGELGEAGVVGGKRTCNMGDNEPVQLQSTDHVLFEGVTLHPQDYDSTPCAGSVNGFHLEMVRIDSNSSYVALQRSTFDDGDHSNTSSVFITNVAGGAAAAPQHLVFQNNFFGTAENTTFGISGTVADCSTFTFAYNTFHNTPGDPTSNGCTTAAGMQWIGNLAPRPAYYTCSGTHVRNLWQDNLTYSCGTDGVINGTRFAYDQLGLGGADGFHLVPGSKAVDAAEDGGWCTSGLGSIDHDGTTRPRGAACDCGGHEL